MKMKDLLLKYNLLITEFCKITNIPYRTAQNWVEEKREPAEWLIPLIETFLENKIKETHDNQCK